MLLSQMNNISPFLRWKKDEKSFKSTKSSSHELLRYFQRQIHTSYIIVLQIINEFRLKEKNHIPHFPLIIF